MGIARGIKDIRQVVAPRETVEREKVDWFSPEPGQTLSVRFANELDENSAHFDTERGLAVVVSQHTYPHDFRRKAQCTKETEGRCWACEQASGQDDISKKWFPKNRFYSNVLVDDGKESKVYVWSMGTYRSATFDLLLDYFGDTGGISNVAWKVRRSGKGTDTTYSMFPGTPDAEPFDWSGVKLFDLNNVVREVPYAEQPAFYDGSMFEKRTPQKEPVETTKQADWAW